MPEAKITAAEAMQIEELVSHYQTNQHWLNLVLEQVRGPILASRDLQTHIHSMKWRLKDPAHLRDKLQRILRENSKKNRVLGITKTNLFTKINDLAGLRILHLHTQQTEAINKSLLSILHESRFTIVEGPEAKTWDDESRKFFNRIGVATVPSETMYTSVHYVVQTNMRTPYTCEIQVRTLMEEVWGEVDHSINYPHKTADVACAEQIAALARVTSGCTRLVDSIFRSDAAASERKVSAKNKKKKKKN